MLLEGKETFKDFTDSDEAIATNILTSKLKQLEALGLVTKSKLPENKKNVYYHLTDLGLSLAPIIVELAVWSDENLRGLHTGMMKSEVLTLIKADKQGFANDLVAKYKELREAKQFIASA
jgi:DNA-binding HxlR family transcriptional regulator